MGPLGPSWAPWGGFGAQEAPQSVPRASGMDSVQVSAQTEPYGPDSADFDDFCAFPHILTPFPAVFEAEKSAIVTPKKLLINRGI